MIKNRLLIAAGFLAFGLGTIGVILPILPTTPFLLLAAYCFSRGSTRFETWLKRTTLYQKYVADFAETGTIAKKQKWKILLNIYLLMGFSIFIVPLMPVKLMLLGLTLFITLYLFFVIPSGEPKKMHH